MYIKDKDINWIIHNLIYKQGTFISDKCLLFPNFKIEGKINKIDIINNEIIFYVNVKSKNNKLLKIGSNIPELQFIENEKN